MAEPTADAAVEREVSSALLAMRCVEDAVFGSGRWTVRWGDIEVEAERTFTTEGVHLSADFPEICHLEPVSDPATLLLDSQIKAIQPLEHPGDTAFTVSWDFRVLRQVSASV